MARRGALSSADAETGAAALGDTDEAGSSTATVEAAVDVFEVVGELLEDALSEEVAVDVEVEVEVLELELELELLLVDGTVVVEVGTGVVVVVVVVVVVEVVVVVLVSGVVEVSGAAELEVSFDGLVGRPRRGLVIRGDVPEDDSDAAVVEVVRFVVVLGVRGVVGARLEVTRPDPTGRVGRVRRVTPEGEKEGDASPEDSTVEPWESGLAVLPDSSVALTLDSLDESWNFLRANRGWRVFLGNDDGAAVLLPAVASSVIGSDLGSNLDSMTNELATGIPGRL